MSRKGENIRRRTDGRWEARYIKERSSDGKAILGYVYAKTYTEAKEKRQQILREQKQKSTNKKFVELTEVFLMQKEYKIKHSTYIHYKDIIDTHIIPHFGNRNLSSLSSDNIEEFANEKLKNGRLNGEGGLSPKSVKDILSVLRQILKYGVQKNLIENEVLNFGDPRVPSKAIATFTKEEIKLIENYCLLSEEHYTLGILICLNMGLRIGEICALKYSDIDFRNSVLKVTKTMMRTKENASSKKTVIRIDEPKTQNSIREIPICGTVKNKLLHQRLNVECEDAYIITGTESYLEPRTYYEKYKKFLNECGISPHSFHCLRHTFATVCIEKGFDSKTLSEILGHSDVKVTLNRYVHPSMQRKRDCMELLTDDE